MDRRKSQVQEHPRGKSIPGEGPSGSKAWWYVTSYVAKCRLLGGLEITGKP